MVKIIFTIGLFIVAVISNGYADTIKLKNGRTFEGHIVEKTDKYIKVNISGVIITYYSDEISEVSQQPKLLKSTKERDDNVVDLLQKNQYIEARQALKEWENENPEDKESIQFLRNLTDQLEKEPDPNKKAALILNISGQYLTGQIKDLTGTLQKTVETMDKLAPMELIGVIEGNDVEKVKALLNKGIDPGEDVVGTLPLGLSAEKGNKEIASILLDKGAKIDGKNLLGETALMSAVQAKQTVMVQFLIEKGANVNATSKTNETALNLAVKNAVPEIIDILKKAGGIESKEVKKWPPPHEPYSSQNVNDNFIEAAAKGDLQKLKEFLEKGAEVDALSTLNWTALMFASNKGNTEIVNFLLSKGADVNKQASMNITAISLACTNGHGEVVKILLDNGANVNQKSDLEMTILMLAVDKGHIDVMKLLLDKGAEIDSWNVTGQTALMIAVEKGDKEAVKLLVEHGVKVNIRDVAEKTALDKAEENGQKEIAQMLLEAGAKHQADK